MELRILVDKIDTFKKAKGTKQSWRKDNSPIYENEYIKLVRIDSSNSHGGNNGLKGKQWGFLMEQKKNFQTLKGWIDLKNEFGSTLKVTPFRSPDFDWVGIRFYEMALDPTNEIVVNILDFIFSK